MSTDESRREDGRELDAEARARRRRHTRILPRVNSASEEEPSEFDGGFMPGPKEEVVDEEHLLTGGGDVCWCRPFVEKLLDGRFVVKHNLG